VPTTVRSTIYRRKQVGLIRIGRLDFDVAKIAEDYAAEAVNGCPRVDWASGSDEIVEIDPLNVASISLFLDHAIAIQGIDDHTAAMKDGRWKHLPFWTESYWLPIGPAEHRIFDTTFFGSSTELKGNLEEMASESPLGLGQAPAHYALMRGEMEKFLEMELPALSDREVIQWVWKALHDAAEESITRNLPIEMFAE